MPIIKKKNRVKRQYTPGPNLTDPQYGEPDHDQDTGVPAHARRDAPMYRDRYADPYGYNSGPPLFFMTPYPYYSHQRPYGLSDRDRRWSNYRYFGGRPSRYGYGRYGYGDDYGGDTYRYGYMRGYDLGRFDKTGVEMQIAAYERHRIFLERALVEFKQGQYHQATGNFKLAADSDRGDPAAKIYAAHTLFALGRYRESVDYLRQAFRLQAKLAMLHYDMRDDYGNKADFDQQFNALEKALELAPNDIDRLIVMSYVLYYTNQRGKAYEVLLKANKLAPKDSLVKILLENCQPPDVVADELNSKKQ